MNKNILIGTVLVSGLALAGCNVAGTAITSAQIQAATLQACQFIPTAVELAGMIPNVSSNVTTDANSIANAICAAVKNASVTPAAPVKAGAVRKSNAPVVANVVLPNGQVVKVTGVFVQ